MEAERLYATGQAPCNTRDLSTELLPGQGLGVWRGAQRGWERELRRQARGAGVCGEGESQAASVQSKENMCRENTTFNSQPLSLVFLLPQWIHRKLALVVESLLLELQNDSRFIQNLLKYQSKPLKPTDS